jgi:hypothetical protein
MARLMKSLLLEDALRATGPYVMVGPVAKMLSCIISFKEESGRHRDLVYIKRFFFSFKGKKDLSFFKDRFSL